MYAYALNTALVRSWYGVGLAVRFVAAASASEPPPFSRCESAGRIFVSGSAGVAFIVERWGAERQRGALSSHYVSSCHTH